MEGTKRISVNSDKKDESISVETIENGFIITRSASYEDENGEWQYENKKWYSDSDPLADTDMSLADKFEL